MLNCHSFSSIFFFFNDTATTEIYTLSLHDALPISEATFAYRPFQFHPRRPVHNALRAPSTSPRGRPRFAVEIDIATCCQATGTTNSPPVDGQLPTRLEHNQEGRHHTLPAAGDCIPIQPALRPIRCANAAFSAPRFLTLGRHPDEVRNGCRRSAALRVRRGGRGRYPSAGMRYLNQGCRRVELGSTKVPALLCLLVTLVTTYLVELVPPESSGGWGERMRSRISPIKAVLLTTASITANVAAGAVPG